MIVFNIDTSELMKLAGLSEAAQGVIQGAAGDLAAMAHGKMIEDANKRLHTRREMYVEALSYFEVEKGVWIVQLDASARWIDDGMPAHNMLESLLNSPKAKTSADGNRYLAVPFDHSEGGATKVTPAQGDLVSTIKSAMKSKGIPFKKIEVNQDGSPKLGLIHSFDIKDKPLKTADGPGQGHGEIGKVRQGNTGIPFLKGVRVYQNQGTDKNGKQSVTKSIMTFRMASDKQKDKWDHPGTAPVPIFTDTVKWIEQTWEKEVAPALLRKIMSSL